MKYSNELKVGVSIVVAVLIFIFGIRFFSDIPLLTGSYELYTQVVDAKGVIPGNPVRTNGVKIGSVKSVEFNQATGIVDVIFRINKTVVVPEGTVCAITGIDALTGVRIEMKLGPYGNPQLPPGGLVPSVPETDSFVNDFVARAPVIVDRVDSILVGLDNTIGTVHTMVGEPNSNINEMLGSLRGSASTLNRLLAEEHERVSAILSNVEAASGSLSQLSTSQADSIAQSVRLLNLSLESLTRSMNSLEGTTSQLDAILGKIDSGEGTLGKLINDPGLYNQLDSLATTMNGVLSDFKSNPRRYLRELKIVDLF